MSRMRWAIAAALALAIPAGAQSPTELSPATPTASAAPSIPEVQLSRPGASLSKADVDAWLDGFFPYALKSGGIPGAVVVIVKDGAILTERGFGLADVGRQRAVDPAVTLFRPGSVSKLLTWTAVMQLVEAGKLDLDRDVNAYLDFRIPAKFGKPITLRNLMTHTSGFAETAKYLINTEDRPPSSLDSVLKRVPDRIYPPGAIPAYSNYGASLAGYIVERVSGEPFNRYVARHIFAPLGMTRSTFDQPLPPALRPLMAKGYNFGSDKAQPFEIIPLAPAGSMSASGRDMGRFMIAHLTRGGKVLAPATAERMHAAANRPFPALPAMALGFYHEDRNGLNIVGHGGDTTLFHSDLHLFLDRNVGLYMSVNSGGREGAAHQLREQLFVAFTDRYFPTPTKDLPTLATAKEHGAIVSGHYVSSRASSFNWLRLVALLGQAKVGVNPDGTISVSSVVDPSGTPRKWREVAPFVWQDVRGSDRLQALLGPGNHVKMFSIAAFAPIIEFVPAPASLNAGWILPVAGLAFLVLLVAAIGWPTAAMVRRRFKATSVLEGRALLLHRAPRVTAWLLLIVAAGWFAMVTAIDQDVSILDDRLNIWMRLLQLVSLAAIAGTALSAWNAYRVATAPGRHIVATTWAILMALAAAFIVWLTINAGLITPSLNY